jgi:hypothetical protein
VLWPEESLPLRDFELRVKAIVAQAVRAAWLMVVEDVEARGGSLLAEPETSITLRLQKALNEIQSLPAHASGFSGSVFQTVERDARGLSFDQRSLDKQPDLTFRLVETSPGIDRTLHGLFAECKVVGPEHPVTRYCEYGIRRFVRGDYAWAMPSGMMIGYARGGFTLAGQLVSFFDGNGPSGMQLHCLSPPGPSIAIEGSPPVFESRHGRPWTYPTSGRSPGDLSLLHLWLPTLTS